MEVLLPAAIFAAGPRTLAVLIANPTPEGGTASFSISVLAAAPTVDEISPTTALATRDTLLTVRGTELPDQFPDYSERDTDCDDFCE